MKTDDEEVIERVLELEDTFQNSNSREEIKRALRDQAIAAPTLALRLRERNARIAVLEKQLGEADAALLTLDGTYLDRNLGSEKRAKAIEAARARKGDHRG